MNVGIANCRHSWRGRRVYNAAQGITGLLLYSEGYWVQVLEGPPAAVTALYARIQQDEQHTQVVTVQPGPRRFAG